MSQIKEDRPSYVRFERKAVEDRAASDKAGHYVARDVDYALVTPVGSKDIIPRVAQDWLKMLDQQAKEERIPAKWVQMYKDAYAAWQKGEEIPVDGMPIKGWQLLSPVQQEAVIRANILTVEDLAQINGEAMTRIGMGALGLRDKAAAWLKAAGGTGKLASEMAALQAQNRALNDQNKKLSEDLQALSAQVAQLTKAA